MTSTRVLYVDLDGTLIAGDLLVEMAFQAIGKNPLLILRIPAWIAKGRAHTKRQLSRYASVDPSLLPYREEVLEFLKAEKQEGTRLVLATATEQAWAEAVADHIGLFDETLASDGIRNLKGSEKTSAILEHCRELGVEGFGYIGDSHADLAVWTKAREIYVVGVNASLLKKTKEIGEPSRVFPSQHSTAKAIWRIIRPKQWAKNFLVFVPLITGHQVFTLNKVAAAVIAFITFCLCASSVYVVNDLLDVSADRAHPSKRRRPFAAGELSLLFGPPLALFLLLTGFGFALFCLPPPFLLALFVYVFLSSAYSFWLKKKIIVDVVVLSMLYALRLVAGGHATEVIVSEWLLAFSLFIFTSLAFAKRYSELLHLSDIEDRTEAKGRGYVVGDIRLLESMGPANGFLAVLVLALYIHSDDVRVLYLHPRVLWLLCPLLLYWVGRLWLVAGRGELAEDPLSFAMTDPRSLGVAVLGVLLMVIASVPW